MTAKKKNNTIRFVVMGRMTRKGRRKSEAVALYVDAEDIEDARWQVSHGVIEMTIADSFPGARVSYDARTLKKH